MGLPVEYLPAILAAKMTNGDPAIGAAIARSERKVAWLVRAVWVMQDEMAGGADVAAFLWAAWLYRKEHKMLPPSPAAVGDFVRVTPPDKHLATIEGYQAVLRGAESLKEWADEMKPFMPVDPDVQLDALFKSTRAKRHAAWYEAARGIAAGIRPAPPAKGETEPRTGPDEAILYIREMLAQGDFRDEAPRPQGPLHENVEVAEAHLGGLLLGGGNWLRTGIPMLDEKVPMGRGSGHNFIVIAGWPADGKSTLLLTVAYSAALAGAHVLLDSLEHDPEQVFAKLCILHQAHPDYRGRGIVLPSYQDWLHGRATRDDLEKFRTIGDDIRGRRNLPGLIDVAKLLTWEELESYAAANDGGRQYDLICVDYLTRLSVDCRPGQEEKAHEADIDRAFNFSRSFRGGAGIAVMSPVPVNRREHERSMGDEFEEGQGHYTLDCVRQYTSLMHNADVVLTVWSDDDMKAEGRMELGIVKTKLGPRPPLLVFVDENSGRVCPLPSGRRPSRRAEPGQEYADQLASYEEEEIRCLVPTS